MEKVRIFTFIQEYDFTLINEDKWKNTHTLTHTHFLLGSWNPKTSSMHSVNIDALRNIPTLIFLNPSPLLRLIETVYSIIQFMHVCEDTISTSFVYWALVQINVI